SSPFPILHSSKSGFFFGVIRDGKLDESIYKLSFEGSQDGEKIILANNSSSGISKRFSFRENSYQVVVKINGLKENDKIVFQGFNGESTSRYNVKSFVFLDSQNRLRRKPITETAEDTLGAVRGVGFDSQYFALFALIGDTSLKALIAAQNIDLPQIQLPLTFNREEMIFTLFIGPKEIRVLDNLGDPYKKLLDLGFFAALADPILRGLLLIAEYVENYGLAIVILTVLIRLALFPLNSMSYKALEKLKQLQPEIERLKKQFENDQQALNRELLLLYQKKGVNPFSGCLPIIIQIPIFFGLYSALLHAVELRHAKFFGWIKDLSQTDYIYLGPIPIPVLTLIFGASFIYQQKLNPPQFTDPAQEAVFKWMPYIILVLFIIVPMPSGLVLYWLINNISSIAQVLISRKVSSRNLFLINLAINVLLVLICYMFIFLFE
ncbi:MAG: membrane protein insertase YidC, partial [Deltaproteobacteria bacterium]|nr:membrane protein insertase YidC [Deltaproteobacteria bacterium]